MRKAYLVPRASCPLGQVVSRHPGGDGTREKPDSRKKEHTHEIRYEMAAFMGLSLPSHSVALVRSGSNRSARLPTPCDACEKLITGYPFIGKDGSGYRKYHISCALRLGIVLPNIGNI